MADSGTKEVDPLSQQNARFAIDGAIAFGMQDIKEPPEGHWLVDYWDIGRNLAELDFLRAQLAALKLELARVTRERDEALRDFKALDELFRLNPSAAYSRAEVAERECEAWKAKYEQTLSDYAKSAALAERNPHG